MSASLGSPTLQSTPSSIHKPIKKSHLLTLSLNFSSCTRAPESTSLLSQPGGALSDLSQNILRDLASNSASITSNIVQNMTNVTNALSRRRGTLPQDTEPTLHSWSPYEESEIPTNVLKSYLAKISNLKTILETHQTSKKTELMQKYRLKRENLDALQKRIPEVYFQEPMDRAALVQEIIHKQGHALNLYQEKIMYWLEQIEDLLSLRLRMEYADIIELLMKLHGLDSELQDVLERIESMKHNVSRMQKICVYDRVQIVKLARRKKNLDQLREYTDLIEKFQILQDKILSNEDSENYLPLFGWIDESIELVQSKLHKLNMFHGKVEELQSKRERLTDQIQKEFNHLLLFSPLKDGATLSAKSTEDLLKLSSVLSELNLLVSCLDNNREAYFDNMKSQFNDIIETVLAFVDNQGGADSQRGNATMSTTQTASIVGAEQIRHLRHQHSMFLLQRVFETILHWIRQALAVDTFFSHHFPELDHTPLHVDIIQTAFMRLSVIFSLRSHSSSTLQKHELVELALKVSDFQRKCCALLQRDALLTTQLLNTIENPIHMFLRAQATAYYDQFHNTQLSKLQAMMENESWTWVKHVPKNFQNIVERLIFMAHSKDVYSAETRATLDFYLKEAAQILQAGEVSPLDTKSEYLNIEGELYPIANSVMILLVDIWEYFEIALDTDLQYIMDPELVCKGLLSLTRLFNDTSRDLVLQAGAVKTVNIPRITARHLLLCSECLHALSALVPSLRKISQLLSNRRHMQESDIIVVPYESNALDVILEEFDNVVVGMKEHRVEISHKIEQIMSKRLIQTSETWKNLEWDSKELTVPTQELVILLKDMASLQKILSSYLATHPEELRKLFTQVISMYYRRLEECVKQIEVRTPEGRKKLGDDVSLVRKNVDKWKKSLLDRFDIAALEKLLANK